jgi:hypothetical protein
MAYSKALMNTLIIFRIYVGPISQQELDDSLPATAIED